MKFLFVFLSALVFAAGTAETAIQPRTPVLLELFTSEGCSSCPPADELLRVLDEKQPIADADLIVLSEHVDYWNQLGWKDPWSAAAYSARQNGYVKRFGLDGPYTPQLVINGSDERVGNDRRDVEAAIRRAATQPASTLTISRLEQTGGQFQFHITAPPAAQPRRTPASIYVALALDHTRSDVARGENAGRMLAHLSVLRSLKRLGAFDPHRGVSQDFTADATGLSGAVRVIVFVQEEGYGRILGAAQARIDRRR